MNIILPSSQVLRVDSKYVQKLSSIIIISILYYFQFFLEDLHFFEELNRMEHAKIVTVFTEFARLLIQTPSPYRPTLA
jgi:hypothetical protein